MTVPAPTPRDALILDNLPEALAWLQQGPEDLFSGIAVETTDSLVEAHQRLANDTVIDLALLETALT